MIKKPLKKSLKLRKLEALSRRTPPSHPKWKQIDSDFGKLSSGYRGEQSLDYYLSFLPDKRYFILHDLRLAHQSRHFQLDVLLLTPCFLLIIEVKNYSGTVFFDSKFRQLIRTLDNGKEEVFPDPVVQVNKQKIELNTWLKSPIYNHVPIETLALFSHPRVNIKASPDYVEILEKVIKSDGLLEKIDVLEKKHKKEKLTPKELNKISRRLIKNHKPLEINALEQYGIAASDLLTGIHCPTCGSLPLERKLRRWRCRDCSHASTDAHLTAMTDYALLISPFINNHQFRKFLHLESISTATKLLASMNLPHSGNTKGRVYRLPLEE